MKLIICILMMCCLFANKQEILSVLDNYNHAFATKDYKSINNNFIFPATFNLTDKTIIASNKIKLKLIYMKIRGELPEYYSYSKWDNIDLEIIDDSIAIVNAQFSRYKKDDSVFYSGFAIYHLRKIKNSWKIFSITPYSVIKYLEN